MKYLSIFKGHEHILGDKIAKFEARALATYSVEFSYSSIINMFVSDMCNRHIVIRDVCDKDYNTSKANKPISYNLRHFIIKQ